MQRYAFPGRAKAVQHQQQQQPQQGQGEGTGQGRAREQASGESAGEAEAATAGGEPTPAPAAAQPPAPITPHTSGDSMIEDEGGVPTAVAFAADELKSSSSSGAATDEASEEEGLPVLLLRELASFRARFPFRVGKHLRADASKNVLKAQVRFRLFFYGFVGREVQ